MENSWLQSKVAAQTKALDALNRRVYNQRLQLRELNDLGRGLTPDEWAALKARTAEANPQVEARLDEELLAV